MTRVHGCSNSAGVFICFSGNGIGSTQFRASPRVERCVKCGRWWKLDHVSPYLSMWSPVPKWLAWLRWHKQWKTERKSAE